MEIEDELNRLAAGVEVPVVDPADDLVRGRARLRRRRAGGGAAMASLAVAAVIGGVALSGSGGGGGHAEEPGYAGQSSGSDLDGDQALEYVRERHAVEPAAVDPPDTIDAALLTYRDVIAEHLDPSGEHLQKRPDNEQSGGGNAEGDVYLGTKLGWSNPGEDGLGMVQIGVASTEAAMDAWWPCGEHRDESWSCRQATDEQTGTSYETASSTASSDDVEMILVHRADGLLVLVALDALFGNNSLVPVQDFGFAAELVVAAASDPRIVLPKDYDPQLEH